ncbi:MAG TPA: AraC family transcriptional regulator, partial [Rubellimicrobium sp.]|nr:AraC family transcriptional regulator [Rubellimicrobium sp.]
MDQGSYHYAVMRRAIDLIDGAEAPLSLEELAAAMSMSPAHFQRLFSAWAGISPKRYQQYLALGHAKALLRDRRAVLEVAGEVGLSGPSRLHDLFVRWEAMTPGSYAREGEGMVIRAGSFATPFGPAVAMGTEPGLCGLGFSAEQGEDAVRADLRARWPRAEVVEDAEASRPWV